MEYTDIVFEDVSLCRLNGFLREVLNVKRENIRRSHFFTEENGDFEFHNSIDFERYFNKDRTCNILVNKIELDKEYNECMVIISGGRTSVDITVNIDSSQTCDLNESFFEDICIGYKIGKVYFEDSI